MLHPKAIVSIPASVGNLVGAPAGVPVAIALLPITATADGIISASKNRSSNWAEMSLGLPSYVLATALGATPWLLFGWWGLPEEEQGYGSPRVFIELVEPYEALGITPRMPYPLPAATPLPTPSSHSTPVASATP